MSRTASDSVDCQKLPRRYKGRKALALHSTSSNIMDPWIHASKLYHLEATVSRRRSQFEGLHRITRAINIAVCSTAQFVLNPIPPALAAAGVRGVAADKGRLGTHDCRRSMADPEGMSKRRERGSVRGVVNWLRGSPSVRGVTRLERKLASGSSSERMKRSISRECAGSQEDAWPTGDAELARKCAGSRGARSSGTAVVPSCAIEVNCASPPGRAPGKRAVLALLAMPVVLMGSAGVCWPAVPPGSLCEWCCCEDTASGCGFSSCAASSASNLTCGTACRCAVSSMGCSEEGPWGSVALWALAEAGLGTADASQLQGPVLGASAPGGCKRCQTAAMLGPSITAEPWPRARTPVCTGGATFLGHARSLLGLLAPAAISRASHALFDHDQYALPL